MRVLVVGIRNMRVCVVPIAMIVRVFMRHDTVRMVVRMVVVVVVVVGFHHVKQHPRKCECPTTRRSGRTCQWHLLDVTQRF